MWRIDITGGSKCVTVSLQQVDSFFRPVSCLVSPHPLTPYWWLHSGIREKNISAALFSFCQVIHAVFFFVSTADCLLLAESEDQRDKWRSVNLKGRAAEEETSTRSSPVCVCVSVRVCACVFCYGLVREAIIQTVPKKDFYISISIYWFSKRL